MIAQVKTLERLEASQNKSFEEVQKEWDDINKRLPEKRRQLDAIQNAITSLEEKQGTLFQKYLNDENRLKHFEVIKNQLKTLGLSMDVLDQIQNFLISIKKLKYDAETAITKLNAVDNLEGKKVELNREIRELETKTNSSKSKLDGIQNLINEKQTLYNELVKLEEMGLSIEQIGLLRNTIVRISANHGKSVKDALAHFQNDMKNYDVMLGLGPEVDRLNRLKNTLNAEIEEAKKDKEEKQRRANKEFEEVNGRIALKKGEIESYSKLQSAGIDDATLLRWGRIIQNSKLSAEVIESELNENSSLKQSFESLRRETKTLETLKAVLTSSTQQLEQTKAELESAITAIKVSALKNMETDVKAKLALIQQDVARTLSNAREGIESTSKEALKSSTEFTTTLRDTLQAVEPQIRNVGMALEAGTKIGKYETILPLLEMIENGVVEEVPAITSILQALKGFRKCTLKNPKIVDQTTIQQVDGLIASLTQRLECVEL